jgi:hypothetical protein
MELGLGGASRASHDANVETTKKSHVDCLVRQYLDLRDIGYRLRSSWGWYQ